MITRPRLLLLIAFAIWAVVVAIVLHIAGLATEACGAANFVEKPPACDWGVEFFAWLLLAVVVIGGASIVKRVATKLGITFD